MQNKDRDLEWQFCQVFGEPGEEITEVDIVSAVEFDNTGEFLAAGDRGGRVVIFQRVEVRNTLKNHPVTKPLPPRISLQLLCPNNQPAFPFFLTPCDLSKILTPNRSFPQSEDTPCEYKFFAEFQSHEPEFDYLKSLEIEEKINKIKWCHAYNEAHYLLTTNGACFLPLLKAIY